MAWTCQRSFSSVRPIKTKFNFTLQVQKVHQANKHIMRIVKTKIWRHAGFRYLKIISLSHPVLAPRTEYLWWYSNFFHFCTESNRCVQAHSSFSDISLGMLGTLLILQQFNLWVTLTQRFYAVYKSSCTMYAVQCALCIIYIIVLKKQIAWCRDTHHDCPELLISCTHRHFHELPVQV